jgi:biotin carboxylase
MSAIIYVARDIERALGAKPAGDYFIIANATPYAEEIRAQYPEHIFLVEKNKVADTYDLLADAQVQKIISEKKDTVGAGEIGIVVFHNTNRIEELCAAKKWNLLNPPAALAEKIENKITQVEWLGDLAHFLPRHQILKAGDIAWGAVNPNKEPFIIQWAHSHTGDGTALVRNEKDIAVIKEKFPEREARVSDFIKGPMFTANICVGAGEKGGIMIGNISYQITGVLPFTDNPFSTIGNDWSVTHSILSPEKIEQFNEIALAVGARMRESGWRGLFGIDCIYDEERDMMHLIEINARQPASTTYESQLQESFRAHIPGMTIFEAHLAALQNEKTKTDQVLIEINDGAQIIQRLTEAANILMESPENIVVATAALRSEGFNVIEYENTKANSDLLRVLCSRGIMEAHLKFNARGKKIVDILLA